MPSGTVILMILIILYRFFASGTVILTILFDKITVPLALFDRTAPSGTVILTIFVMSLARCDGLPPMASGTVILTIFIDFYKFYASGTVITEWNCNSDDFRYDLCTLRWLIANGEWNCNFDNFYRFL